jgi:hypothetical protein
MIGIVRCSDDVRGVRRDASEVVCKDVIDDRGLEDSAVRRDACGCCCCEVDGLNCMNRKQL